MSKKDKFQYYIQVGNFPHIEFASVSQFCFTSKETAIADARRELTKRGYTNIKMAWIHTRKLRRTKHQPKRVKYEASLCAPMARSNTSFTILDKMIRVELGEDYVV